MHRHQTFEPVSGVLAKGGIESVCVTPGADGENDDLWLIVRRNVDGVAKRYIELLKAPLPFDNFGQLRAAMFAEVPALAAEGLMAMPWAPPKLDAKADGPVAYPVRDFYITSAICRASPTLKACSDELVHGRVQTLEAAE